MRIRLEDGEGPHDCDPPPQFDPAPGPPRPLRSSLLASPTHPLSDITLGNSDDQGTRPTPLVSWPPLCVQQCKALADRCSTGSPRALRSMPRAMPTASPPSARRSSARMTVISPNRSFTKAQCTTDRWAGSLSSWGPPACLHEGVPRRSAVDSRPRHWSYCSLHRHVLSVRVRLERDHVATGDNANCRTTSVAVSLSPEAHWAVGQVGHSHQPRHRGGDLHP